MATINDLVNKLPKPETLEEQYMYALVCSVAGVTPKYGVASDAAFKRLEQYWKAFWLVASKKFTDLETPAANTVSNEAIRNNAVTTEKVADESVTTEKVAGRSVTLEKLADEVVDRLWATNRNNTVTEAMLVSAVREKLVGNTLVQTDNIADEAVTSAKIATGTIAWENLDANVQAKINDKGVL